MNTKHNSQTLYLEIHLQVCPGVCVTQGCQIAGYNHLDERVPMATQGSEREMFYLTTHSKHFIYGYMALDLWLRTILIVRKETRCRHIVYSYRLTASVLLYAPFHRQDNTYTAFVTLFVEHWLEREIAQWVHPMKDRSDDPLHHERTLYL